MAPPLPSADIELVLNQTHPFWEEMRGQRIFITGGTGFFGSWLLESFAHANRELNLKAQATVLTRDPEKFAVKSPHLAVNPSIAFLQGDVRNFIFPTGEFAYVIHAATEASLYQSENAPLEMLTTIVDGTRRILEFARARGTRKFLLTSSGAVYGKQPSDLTHVSENYVGSPDPLLASSVYGEGKRMAEQLCVLHSAHSQMECKIARCFAFVGPHLPLDTHFAVGNFIRDAMQGTPVLIQGDGTPMRSYLYAADLAIWLWTILFRAPALRAYNVGSEDAVSILELAKETATALLSTLEIRVAKPSVLGAPILRYVPATARARQELGLQQHVPLREAIQRTAKWCLYR